MRLRKVKMAGFKSFVDPTTLVFPSDMVGIVGPNGCGKSNIVDAIRWVMGASSKHIRGDTLDDVIFKGSSGRQPVGQASIELVFDNSAGKAGGQYASYAEIAVRRQVSRDGQSKYFLNGSSCRRRDVVDIFLGTGLGPRSYAIIEQGMISRLIDAKPEELRVYLEEAAGISKYKERRRETENRIRHTRENLDRLNDLIDEITKQIARLKRQANTAERYKTLKSEERRTKAELLLLKLQKLQEDLIQQQTILETKQTALEESVARLRAVEATLETQREQHALDNEKVNAVQGKFYEIGSEISRLEQAIQHATESKQRQQRELQELSSQIDHMQSELKQQHEEQASVQATTEEKTQALQQLEVEVSTASEKLANSQSAERAWREAWDALMSDIGEPSLQVERQTQQISSLQQQIDQTSQRQQKFIDERHAHSQDQQASDLEPATVALQQREEELDARQTELQQRIVEIDTTRSKLSQQNQQLEQMETDRRGFREELTTLQALQKAALQGKQESSWIEQNQLSHAPILIDQIEVEAGWESAVETALQGYLEAVCTSDISAVARNIQVDQPAQVMCYDTTSTSAGSVSGETLASKVKSSLALGSQLDHVFTAANLNEALTMRSRLAPHQSVITTEGIWISPSWLRFSKADDQEQGVLNRKAHITDLQSKLDAQQAKIEVLQSELIATKQQLQQNEQAREQAQQAHNQAFQLHAEGKAGLQKQKAAIEHWQQRNSSLSNLIDEANELLVGYQRQLEQATDQRTLAQTSLDSHLRNREALAGRKDGLITMLDQARADSAELQNRRHALQLEIESGRTRLATSTSAIERIGQQMTRSKQRVEELSGQISEVDKPIDEMNDKLKSELARRVEVEQSLQKEREALAALEQSIRAAEEQRMAIDQQIGEQRETLNQLQIDSQESKVRAQTIEEQLQGFDFSLDELAEQLAEEASLPQWEQNVNELEAKINRLGPINLAAIDEFKEQSERKEYLDSQHEDLTKALETLEGAMHKIDRETKDRFKDTFDRVNAHIQRMYPRLFPNGSAYLEMTGDDLLTAGVVIMARPPGKRVSSIQLLSGGEKALTAVALVLAIFELNPAPFCLLDEVDAPLDDANVGRFCDLIKDMSDQVQFVFITHNKTTMEYADHLMGVTMHEPGVSRLVSVDVEAAAEMANAN